MLSHAAHHRAPSLRSCTAVAVPPMNGTSVKGSPPRLLGNDFESGPCWLCSCTGKKLALTEFRVPLPTASRCPGSTNSEDTCSH
ncbi:MAG: hypothetical protein [Circular genetic element sp.]|nr:MAG: hypothetical protein [Circular genetic element sp.]